MAAKAPLASFENPIYSGARSMNRSTMTGALHENVSRATKVQTFELNASLPGAGKIMNLRTHPLFQGSEPIRPYSRSAWIGTVSARVRAITAAALYQNVQQS